MDLNLLLEKATSEDNYIEVYRLYDQIYPDDIYFPEEGLSVDLCITQKAAILSENGKHNEALRVYQTVLTMKIAEFGEKSREAQTIRQYMGSVLMSQHQLSEALLLLQDVLDKQIEILGDIIDSTKQDVYETRHIIAMVLEKQGKIDEALAVYEKVYTAFAEFNGAEVDYTAHVAFTVKSLNLKIAAKANENLTLEEIIKVVGYGPSVLSIFEYGDDGKDTVLHRAVRSNVVALVSKVIDEIIAECGENKEKLGEFLNFENSEIQTPLTLSVKYECEGSVKILLEKGVACGLSVTRQTSFGGTALKMAEVLGNQAMTKLLLEYNKDY